MTTPETSDIQLDADLMRDLYRKMVVTRNLDSEAIAMQRQGILPAYPPLRGQEAAQIGSGAAIDATRDFAFPAYREMGIAVALGVDMVAYFASHLNTWHGAMYDPIASHFGSINAVVGGGLTHAVGWAKGAQLSGTDGVAISFLGDGASSEGDAHEAMNFAGVYQLPVVFFCQNNGWAISVPTARQVAGGSVAARAAGYGMPGVQVDGNDVVAVYEATRDAIARARAGEGPTVVEAMTYRVGPHATSDDPGRYRTLDDEQEWVARDPLTVMEARLRAAGIADDEFFAQALADAKEFTETVREGIIATTGRPADEMFDFVFANPPAALLEQQQQWREGATNV